MIDIEAYSQITNTFILLDIQSIQEDEFEKFGNVNTSSGYNNVRFPFDIYSVCCISFVLKKIISGNVLCFISDVRQTSDCLRYFDLWHVLF